MSFWLREIVGWLLVLIGLYFLYFCFLLLRDRAIVEAGSLSIIGIIVFRGGIHLLKVATAARICREARERTKTARPAQKPAAKVTGLAGRGPSERARPTA